jgi:uncharacterized protein (DUF2147 family)
MSTKWSKIPCGSLVEIKSVPDQSGYVKTFFSGLKGVILKNLGEEDGIYSSKSLYEVQLESGKIYTFHFLDLEIISWNE